MAKTEKQKKRFKPLKGYEIAGCAAISKDSIALWGQKWSNNDALDKRPTSIFSFSINKPIEKQWAARGPAYATGVYGCAGRLPVRQWIFVFEDGETYLAGSGIDDFGKKITKGKKSVFFTNVRAINSGEVFAVGSGRKVYFREAKDTWRQWDQGLEISKTAEDIDDAGFSDIAGFNLDELYACGDQGDLWLCKQSQWMQIDLNTNASLTHVCCASDGFVYVTTQEQGIYKGRNDKWELIEQDINEDIFESLVDFSGRILISTDTEIFEIVDDKLVVAYFPEMPIMESKAHLAVGEDVLVVAGKDEAVLFDGKAWIRFLEPEK